jgi:phosphoribosylaminoimidazole-succinocarboxamide synthase
METRRAVGETSLTDLRLLHRGKVRDVYEIDSERLLLVATDRISAFDCVLPTLIARKGEVLTRISAFWFRKLGSVVTNHLITTDIGQMPPSVARREELRGRSSLVRKTAVFPVECVVRGYLEGSGWKDYRATGTVCGHALPDGMMQCQQLPEPLFTPATKASAGHDENIDFVRFSSIVGTETAERLREASLELYRTAAQYARDRGIIIADTKFEFGLDHEGNITLIDELLTPDSSRFWSAEGYEPGRPQASFDKQFVREYLETLDWDKTPPAPELPAEVADATSRRYRDAFELLTGETF